jgi:hypothetical protein
MPGDPALTVLALKLARVGQFELAWQIGAKSADPAFVDRVVRHLARQAVKQLLAGAPGAAFAHVGDGSYRGATPHGTPPPSVYTATGELTPEFKEAARYIAEHAFEAGREHERKKTGAGSLDLSRLGPVRQIPTSALATDPARFQFRHGHDAEDGTVSDLPAEPFDSHACEPLIVWRDSADKTDYVIDGHHRLAWAERDGAKRIPVRFLDVPTAAEAKAYGERLNREQAPATFAAPGPPPRPGLQWRDETSRWIRPETGEEHEHTPGGAAVSQVHYHGPSAPAAGWKEVGTDPHGVKVWQAPPKQPGIVGRLLGKKKPPAGLDPVQAGHADAHTLQARMAANHEYQQAEKSVAARNAGGFQQLANKEGKPVEEVKKELANKAQKLVDGQDVFLRVKGSVLPQILQSGRFKTVHETGTSDALANPKIRKEVEAKGMGISSDEPNDIRPVSVYLGGKDFSTVGQERGVASYGVDHDGSPAVIVKLKPRVRDRTTVTFGDSLSELQNGKAVASPLNAVSVNTINPSEVLHNPHFLDSHAGYHASKGFIEGQVHGGLSTDDIAEIGFPAEPPAPVRQALDAKGIKWRVYGSGGAQTHSAALFSAFAGPELFTLEDVNAFAARPDGSQWQTNGRWYRREGGKTVRIPNPNASQDTGAKAPAKKETPKEPAKSPPPPPPPPTKTQQKQAAQAAVKAEVEAAIADVKSANLPALATRITTLTKADIQALAKKASVYIPSGSTKEKAAQKFISALKKQKEIKHMGESAPLVAGGKPSTHFDHIPNGTDFSAVKPSKAFTDANPYASAKGTGDDYVTGRPNPELPDETRPGVKEKATARFLNNYTWGYDAPLNEALRKTGAPPPGPFGGEPGPIVAFTPKAATIVQMVMKKESPEAIAAALRSAGPHVQDELASHFGQKEYDSQTIVSAIEAAKGQPQREPGKPDVDGPRMFAALQQTFKKTKPFGPPPVKVYRGLTSLPPETIANIEAAAKKAQAAGSVVTMPGFVSTSTDRMGAFDGPVQFTIDAIHGIDTKPYSHFPAEDELLLNHNCQYRVKNVTRSGGTVHIELEQVSSGNQPKGTIALDGEKYSARLSLAA